MLKKTKGFLAEPEMKELIKVKALKTDQSFHEYDNYFGLAVKNSTDEKISEIFLEKSSLKYGFVPQGESEIKWIASEEMFKKSLLEHFQTLSSLSQAEIAVQQKKEEFQALLSEDAFQDTLKEQGLIIELEPIEEDDRLYFEIKNASGVLIQLSVEGIEPRMADDE